MPVLRNRSARKVFAHEFLNWWASLQPQWRNDQDGRPTQRSVPDNADWAALCRGGQNGVFLVLVALSWWVGGCEKIEGEVHTIMEDVCWALQRMVSVGGKIKASDTFTRSAASKENPRGI